jgi:hypothetical protein
MTMQLRKLLWALVALTASAASYAAAPLDIVGIKVGMPADEAIKVLKAHNPQATFRPFEVQFNEMPGQKMLRHFLAHVPNGELVQVEFALQPGPSIVTAISRGLPFKQGQEPTRENLLASLREKYGREAFKTWPDVYFWHFDGAGRPVPKNAVCDPVFSSVDGGRVQVGQGVGYSAGNAELLQQRAQKCGSVVGVSLEGHANPQLVSRMSMVVADEQLTADRHKATTEFLLRTSEQQKNQQTKDAGKRAGPKL